MTMMVMPSQEVKKKGGVGEVVVSEEPAHFLLQAVVPATVPSEWMEVRVEGEKVLVMEVKGGGKEEEEEEVVVWRRKYAIPHSVEVAKIETTYRAGVWTVLMPKRPVGGAAGGGVGTVRKLWISAGDSAGQTEQEKIAPHSAPQTQTAHAEAEEAEAEEEEEAEESVDEDEEDEEGSQHSSMTEQSSASASVSVSSSLSSESTASVASSAASTASSKRMMVTRDVYIETVEDEDGEEDDEYEVVVGSGSL
jgi:hypothetical protein